MSEFYGVRTDLVTDPESRVWRLGWKYFGMAVWGLFRRKI